MNASSMFAAGVALEGIVTAFSRLKRAPSRWDDKITSVEP